MALWCNRIRHGWQLLCDVLPNRKIVRRSHLEGGVLIGRLACLECWKESLLIEDIWQFVDFQWHEYILNVCGNKVFWVKWEMAVRLDNGITAVVKANCERQQFWRLVTERVVRFSWTLEICKLCAAYVECRNEELSNEELTLADSFMYISYDILHKFCLAHEKMKWEAVT